MVTEHACVMKLEINKEIYRNKEREHEDYIEGWLRKGVQRGKKRN